MKTGDPRKMRVLVAVGSRRDRVCSIGAFARAEALALAGTFGAVDVLEPDAIDRYPVTRKLARPDVIIFHAPSLHDRGKPWRPLLAASKLRARFPRALFIPVVHEFSEAPTHWKLRQIMILKLAHAAIVNCVSDYEGLRGHITHLVRAHLGPTLFIPELLDAKDRGTTAALLEERRASARRELAENEKLVLHPGLLVPGKGINFLGKLQPVIGPGARLVIMGGVGPRESDREFARATLASLREALRGRVSFIDSPDDALFRQFLTAADLVVLPYDAGLSERRSSFLSAMCCGANVWTTTGPFTGPLAVESSGAHLVPSESWRAGQPDVIASVARALAESESRMAERRLANIEWARGRSWQRRVGIEAELISSLR